VVHVEESATALLAEFVEALAARIGPRAIYAKELRREVRTARKEALAPMLVWSRDESVVKRRRRC